MTNIVTAIAGCVVQLLPVLPELARDLVLAWVYHAPQGLEGATYISLNVGMDWVFPLEGAVAGHVGDEKIHYFDRPYLSGVWDTALQIDLARPQRQIAFRLRSTAMADLLGAPLHEVYRTVVSCADLDDRWFKEVEERSMEHRGLRARSMFIQQQIAARLRRSRASAGRARHQIPWVEEALRRMGDPSTRVKVGALADDLGLSYKAFERGFRHWVGYPPKDCLRVLRTRRVINELRDRDEGRMSLQVIADRVGYVDAPHLSHEFRRTVGLAPGMLPLRAGPCQSGWLWERGPRAAVDALLNSA